MSRHGSVRDIATQCFFESDMHTQVHMQSEAQR